MSRRHVPVVDGGAAKGVSQSTALHSGPNSAGLGLPSALVDQSSPPLRRLPETGGPFTGGRAAGRSIQRECASVSKCASADPRNMIHTRTTYIARFPHPRAHRKRAFLGGSALRTRAPVPSPDRPQNHAVCTPVLSRRVGGARASSFGPSEDRLTYPNNAHG